MQAQEARKAKVRLASVVIVAAFLSWMGVSLAGGALGLPARYAFLADMLCLAALGWALWTLLRVWRADGADAGEGK
ncbi:DUF5337 family protein [Oceanicella actignis]|uniref:DUF5337 domain-containing protein n=1 Tax=Oceanicella actignis TaxID=1189325 RepID=A0A1M7S0J6_9RHOB|nr:DUF5337 family protein [Oceanicella actignis]TYO90078.1 hypothetical protein LY05_01277 [Oceanicella actignis]SES94159.1 hypothetical protein SAMN04488119_102151 [Oceanicella actignis]SHN51854.1 hypothetical protein SAMN05216200_101367 [Oceanicella actignis]